MNLSEINDTFSDKQKATELEYLESIGQWIKQFKPDAKTFEFEGYAESNDEGGSSMYYSSLYIDDQDLEEIVPTLDKEKILEWFEISDYLKEDFLEAKDPEEIWDYVRDNLNFKDCVYEYGKQKI